MNASYESESRPRRGWIWVWIALVVFFALEVVRLS